MPVPETPEGGNIPACTDVRLEFAADENVTEDDATLLERLTEFMLPVAYGALLDEPGTVGPVDEFRTLPGVVDPVGCGERCIPEETTPLGADVVLRDVEALATNAGLSG